MSLSLEFSPGRTRFWIGIIFAVFAVWLPMRQGIAFLDSVSLGAYACLGVIFAAPTAADTGRVARPVLVGLAISWAMLVTGIALVYATRNVVVGVELRSLAKCGIFGAMLAGAVASVTAFVRKKSSQGAARGAARAILFSLLALFYFKSRWLPDVAFTGAVLLAGVWLLFTWLPRRAT